MARLIFLLVMLWGATARAEPVTVFAAASLKEVLEGIAESFAAQVRFSFAGSSVLARQVAAGAPADVYISANVAWMDWLEGQGSVVVGSRRDVVGNALVLVASPLAGGTFTYNTGTGVTEIFGDNRIAMGLVDAVPAGIYGRQALISLGGWESVREQVVQTDNVRAALALVALGEAPLGIVYASDALAEPRVVPVFTFPADSHDPIVYPGAAVTERGRAFLDHLGSAAAQATFAAHGFEVLR